MIREKYLQECANLYLAKTYESLDSCDIEFINCIIDAFEAGAKWADNNPLFSWINVKNDLPYNHEELLNAKYETKKVFILKPGGFPDIDYMLKVDGKWIWFTNKSPEFWMPVPKSPKE